MRRARSKTKYDPDWQELARQVKTEADWKCERCTHKHDPKTGHTLTVHHLDGNKSNNEPWNLAVLCQRCHLVMQNVIMDQLLFDFVTVSDWFKPHLDGYRKAKKRPQE